MTSASATPAPLPKNAPTPPKTPLKNDFPRRPHPSRLPIRRILHKVLLLVAGIAIGALTAKFFLRTDRSAEIASELGTRVKPGPWGELYCVPFTIAAPDELIPIRTIESGGTHWWFKNSTRTEISNLLESAGLPSEQRDALLDPAVAHIGIMDIELKPTPEMIVALPAKARQAIYRKLAQFPENRAAFSFFHKDTLRDRFDDSGVSNDTLALFHKLCCEHGDYLVLSGLPALLSQLPSYEEKLRFMKALTRQKTMLIRLRVTKDSDPKIIAADYFPISGDPTLGDILILAKPDGNIVHSAVFIADEIVFTKNGATAIFPWMFSTVPDLLKQYSFHAPDGQQLTLRYYRNKGL